MVAYGLKYCILGELVIAGTVSHSDWPCDHAVGGIFEKDCVIYYYSIYFHAFSGPPKEVKGDRSHSEVSSIQERALSFPSFTLKALH